MDQLELFGQISDVKNKTRERRSRTTVNIATVHQIVKETSDLSIRRSWDMKTLLHRTLHEGLSF